jgi:16S rRNA (guanine966-N2)-methyltransferase
MSVRIHGNRLLQTLPGELTRPTLAKVRQAIFNIWQGTLTDCHWLDLCAGSGAMGAEALCRGAATAIAIERSPAACAVIRQNWRQVAQPTQSWQVIQGDAVKMLRQLEGKTFDRIYFDPPYASDLYAHVFAAIVQYQLLSPTGELAVEHSIEGWQLAPAGLQVCREKRYGRTAVTFYQPVAAPTS